MPRRYFTLEEASALLPRLTELLTSLRERRRALLAREQQQGLRPQVSGHTNGTVHAGAREASTDEDIAAMNAILREIQELGIEVKDLDTGLVDFPALRDGREVYLCWRLDEPAIGWWHDLDTGFAGRQPL